MTVDEDKRLLAWATLLTVIVVVVLALDLTIKNHILREARELDRRLADVQARYSRGEQGSQDPRVPDHDKRDLRADLDAAAGLQQDGTEDALPFDDYEKF
jgi:hypothetical protein